MVSRTPIHDPARRPGPPKAPLVTAVVAVGGNLGDRRATLIAACEELAATPGVVDLQRSPLVSSAAVKLSGVDESAPAYLNGVVVLRTRLTAHALLDALQRIELAHGRVREERWGDRTLDLDLIAYDDAVIDDDRLTVPHPRAAERAFVVVPWLLLDPDAALPGVGRLDSLAAAQDGTVTADEEPTR
ncbi:2-amino-4-hydroxy-6-hydroxymethyldihydropteridine diphosphokinase [Plantibacter flavus]|uniref:2-amino-4-hydroxy-6- hydroxymethyldihydropteridine diphosphokinase n=1 Tax=Plantibacter flavus TaxID=150123 RepID=UPI003F170C57